MAKRVLTALPVFNEERHVRDVLAIVRQFAEDILVVDDGSSDGTAMALARETDVHVITHEQNLGYGGALRTAFEFAIEQDYDVLVTIDCDGQHAPRLIPALADAVFPLDDEPLDIVSGSRYLEALPGDSLPPADRRRINMEVTAFLNQRMGWQLTDSFCGFKAYRVESLSKLHITELGYAMPLQLWVQAWAAGMRIREFPVPLIYLDEKRTFGGTLDDANRRRAYYDQVMCREFTVLSLPCGAAT